MSIRAPVVRLSGESGKGGNALSSSIQGDSHRQLGPLGGGWIYDRFGGYAWLYIGSFALGLGAVAIALAFPPISRPVLARPVT